MENNKEILYVKNYKYFVFIYKHRSYINSIYPKNEQQGTKVKYCLAKTFR